MPGKQVQCPHCSKVMRSDNLKNHVKRHSKSDIPHEAHQSVGSTSPTTYGAVAAEKRPRSPELPTFSEVPVKKAKNSKITNLLDAIINESPEDQTTYTPLVPVNPMEKPFTPQAPLTVKSMEKPFTPRIVSLQELRPITIDEVLAKKQPMKVLPSPLPEIIADIFPSKGPKTPPSEIIDEILPSKDLKTIPKDKPPQASRTKDDIMDYSDTESDTVSDDAMEDVEFILPETIEEIQDRFNNLYVEFMREKKHEHIDELHLLLDEMLRQDAVTPADYARLNTTLSESDNLKTDKTEKEDDEDSEDYQKSTIDYIIQHDKEELLELIEELKENEELVDEVLKIEELIEIFLEKEFVDGEPTKPMVEEAIKKLENSDIPKSQQHRLKMLLDDIARNRYRVQQLIQRLMDAEDKDGLTTILRMLVREGLLSDEQFEQLAEMEDPDLEKIKEVIMDTKIGQGLNFLPRTISNLRHALHSLLTDLKEDGTELIKSKAASILEELFHRNAIRLGEYENLKALTV